MIDPSKPDYSRSPNKIPRYYFAAAEPASDLALSIVTPFYNTGEVFRETAASVLNQSLQNFEWIIVDDGSTNQQSLEALEEVAQSDPRIRIVRHHANKGLSAARNTGYRSARSDLVLQLDSDDLLEPTCAEKWVWYLRTHPQFGWVGSYSIGFGAQEYLWRRSFEDREVFLYENLAAPTSAVRTSAFHMAGGYDESNRHGLEDWDFWLRGASAGLWGANVPEFLNWYRRRPSHDDRWGNWTPEGIRRFIERWKARAPALYAGAFPSPQGYVAPLSSAPANELELPARKRILLVAENSGDDRISGTLAKFARPGTHCTAVFTETTDGCLPDAISSHIDETFFSSNIVVTDNESSAFMNYLCESRKIDDVIDLRSAPARIG